MKNTITAKDKVILSIFAILITAAIIIMFVFGPDLLTSPKSRYDAGYDDGFRESYNTLCKKRATNIEGDWDDKNYYKGYMIGQLTGASKCDGEKRAKAFEEKNKQLNAK